MSHNNAPDRLPARIDLKTASQLLGFKEYELVMLVSRKLLKPLGMPIPHNGRRYFALLDIEAKSRDLEWLDRATKVVRQQVKIYRGVKPQIGAEQDIE